MPWQYKLMIAWSAINFIWLVGVVGSRGKIRWLGPSGFYSLFSSIVGFVLFYAGANGIDGWKHVMIALLYGVGVISGMFHIATAKVDDYNKHSNGINLGGLLFAFFFTVGTYWLIITG